jgi:hypothetical protein
MTPVKSKRDVTMNLRTSAEIKRMISALAKADNLSIARTIEQLIRAEHAKRKRRAQS